MGKHYRSVDGGDVLYVGPVIAVDGTLTLLSHYDTREAARYELSVADRRYLASELLRGLPGGPAATGCEHALCYDGDGHWDGCDEVDRQAREDRRP